jgi:hypothetical protein
LFPPGALRASESGAPQDVSYFSFFDGWGGDGYALDRLERFVEAPSRVQCEPDAMVVHASKALRYRVRVHPAFVERLDRFERFVTALASEHYGRAPRKLVHRGAFACRSVRTRPDRISEHALGNALDFQGLDFGPLPRRVEVPAGMPRALRAPFSLRVLQHWSPKRERDRYHAAFLHRLAEELRGRPDIFRGVVGPPRPRHRDHLHLDAAPWRYSMFGYDHPE